MRHGWALSLLKVQFGDAWLRRPIDLGLDSHHIVGLHVMIYLKVYTGRGLVDPIRFFHVWHVYTVLEKALHVFCRRSNYEQGLCVTEILRYLRDFASRHQPTGLRI